MYFKLKGEASCINEVNNYISQWEVEVIPKVGKSISI